MSDINIVENSIWPTTDGRLGINKVSIPDGVNTFWPEGNAFVKNFIYKDDKLIGYIDTKSLIENETKTSVLPYEYVDITLDKRLEYSMTFEKSENCKYFNIKYEASLPFGYKRLDYLESTGTQHIVTDIIPTISDSYELVYSQKSLNDDIARACFGGFNYPNIRWQYGERGTLYPDFCWMWTGTVGYAVSNLHEKGKKYTLRLSANDITLDGVTMRLGSSSVSPDVNSIRPIHIFSNGTTFASCKIWLFRYKNGNDHHEFIPALDPTGAPCMFDLDARRPFYNSGTDDFIYSIMENQSSTYSLRNRMYGKMTEYGIRRLYHAPIDYSGTKEDYASENGFKQLVEFPRPEEGNWIPKWRETDTELICEWIEEENPSEI